MIAVSGWDEATDVYRDPDTFSSCNSVIGPFATFPVPLEGDDIGAIIERYRDQLPMNEHMVTMDPPEHTRERALLMRLITPKRLKENEAFMWRLADQPARRAHRHGPLRVHRARTPSRSRCSWSPTSSVCPKSEHERFRDGFGLSANPGELGDDQSEHGDQRARSGSTTTSPTYIEDRRREPRGDVLTDLALAKYPDGSTPDVIVGRAHARRSCSPPARRRRRGCSPRR